MRSLPIFQKILALVAIVFLVFSCSSEEVVQKEKEQEKEQEVVFPVTLKHEYFEIGTPQGWELTREQGIDTYIGRITNGEIEIFYDLGWLSFNGLGSIKETEHTVYMEQLVIDGVPAIIVKESRPDIQSTLGIYIDGGISYRTHLYVFDPAPEEEELIKNIFKSHRFTEAY